jgi:hypothetical protein
MAGVAEKRRPPTSLVGAILMRDMFMQERALGMARVTADKGLRWKSNRGAGGRRCCALRVRGEGGAAPRGPLGLGLA